MNPLRINNFINTIYIINKGSKAIMSIIGSKFSVGDKIIFQREMIV